MVEDWKGQFGTNPNPPCQHSLREETRVPGKIPTTFGRGFNDSFHINVLSPEGKSNPRIQCMVSNTCT
jgi:hypothetical protein